MTFHVFISNQQTVIQFIASFEDLINLHTVKTVLGLGLGLRWIAGASKRIQSCERSYGPRFWKGEGEEEVRLPISNFCIRPCCPQPLQVFFWSASLPVTVHTLHTF